MERGHEPERLRCGIDAEHQRASCACQDHAAEALIDVTDTEHDDRNNERRGQKGDGGN